MCDSTKVAALSFTGSTRVGKFFFRRDTHVFYIFMQFVLFFLGKILYRQCADTVKKISLELGGNAPFIVFDSADLDLAIKGMMVSKFRNAGQTCVSSNRVLVQSGIYDKFVKLLRETVDKEVKSGDGMKQGVNQGPLINQRQFKRVCDMVDDAQGKGAKLVMGGGNDPVGKLFYKPTILTDLSSDMDLYKEEIFGPVISLLRFQDEEVIFSPSSIKSYLHPYSFTFAF